MDGCTALHFTSTLYHPSGLRTLAEVLLVPAGLYGLVQLGHLKQPKSPDCPTNDELELLNSSLFNGSEAWRQLVH